MPDGQEDEDDNGEDHLHVGPWSEAEDAKYQQLKQLATSEHVDLTLGNFPEKKRSCTQYYIVVFTSLLYTTCLLYTSPSPRDLSTSRMPSSA